MEQPRNNKQTEERMKKSSTAQAPNAPAHDQEDMLTIQTSRFGEITVLKNKIISMTSPILGFPDSRRFVLQPHGAQSPLMWLQSADDPQLAFVVIQPELIIPEYHPAIAMQLREELQAADDKDIELLIILTIPHNNPMGMTANLLAPLVINPNTRLARQTLLDPMAYDCCWPVFSEEQQGA